MDFLDPEKDQTGTIERTGRNMFIYVNSAKQMEVTKLVNTVGKSLYKKLDGSYSFKKGNGFSEVKSTILYQIPKEVSDRYNLAQEEREKVNVMEVTISITTYSNKLRVEVIELSPEEKTIAFKTFKSDMFNNIQQGISVVYDFITSSIEKEFNGYEILF